jgi:hypothetical protein
MEKEISKSDWLFLLACLFLGIISEESFFRGFEIGISYLVFIVVFYGVFYWRYHHFSFSHQRLGWFVLICIWLLAATYFMHNTPFFYFLNIMVIPGLVLFHIVLITSPHQMQWNRLPFVAYLFSRLIEAIKYNRAFASSYRKNAKKGMDQSHLQILKKVIIGLIISIPVLAVVLTLLMSADSKFKQLVGGLPEWFNIVNAETITRIMIILLTTALFFGILQVLLKKQIKIIEAKPEKQFFQLDGIIVFTVLVVMNLVYLLFTFVQFKYFFGGTLQGDFTFAQYARKGFFELLFVSIINLSVIVAVLTFVTRGSVVFNRLTQIMLTILVLSSSVMLCSAFLRLSMYEDAYGFTFTRILAHSFMIFLTIIFAYTLVKVWIENLSLVHFVFITSLIYYVAINTVDLDQLVVAKNIDRFEASGKVDVQYLNSLSYTGVLGLMSLYEKDKNIPALETILQQRQEQFNREEDSWQSYNLKKQQVKKELLELKLN